MPITKAAKKAVRQSGRKRERNLGQRTKMKELLKEVKGFVAEGKIKEAKEILPRIYKVLDKASKNGLIKKNTASRSKSRIARSIKSR